MNILGWESANKSQGRCLLATVLGGLSEGVDTGVGQPDCILEFSPERKTGHTGGNHTPKFLWGLKLSFPTTSAILKDSLFIWDSYCRLDNKTKDSCFVRFSLAVICGNLSALYE